ncbi:hypothetical protein QJQ45_006479 [Haematococcus lacustris]|nr:hypothetical protein QJQ45_006479 [Haematococcus lacustris]
MSKLFNERVAYGETGALYATGLLDPRYHAMASTELPLPRSLSVLSLVPERRELQRDVLSTLGAQFWSQPTQSSGQHNGLAYTAPGEPTALPLLAPTGIARTQLIVAGQAATLPALPCWCAEDGGFVTDRVLLHNGGDHWWATLAGRAKVQRILAQRRRSGWKSALDTSQYRLSSDAKVSFRPGSTLKARATFQPGARRQAWNPHPPPQPSQRSSNQPLSSNGQAGTVGIVAQLSTPRPSAFQGSQAAAIFTQLAPPAEPAGPPLSLPLPAPQAGPPAAGGSVAPAPPHPPRIPPNLQQAADKLWQGLLQQMPGLSGAAQWHHKLRRAEVRVDVSANQPMRSSGRGQGQGQGQGGQTWAPVPLLASLDVATPQNQASALQYRVGLLHATAPSTLSLGGQGEAGAGGPLRNSTMMQAGLALQGERTLWSGSAAARCARNQQALLPPGQRSGTTPGGPPPLTPSHLTPLSGTGLRPVGSSTTPTDTSAAVPGAAAGGGGALGTGIPTLPGAASRGAAGGAAGSMGGAGAIGSRPAPRSKVLGPHNPIRQLLHSLLHQAKGAGGQGGGGAAAVQAGVTQVKEGVEEAAAADGWPHLHVALPEAGQEAVLDSTQAINRLREDVQSLTDWVASGAAGQQLGAVAAGALPLPLALHPAHAYPPKQRPARIPQPWNSLLGAPHLQVAGLVGLVARHPLWLHPPPAMNPNRPNHPPSNLPSSTPGLGVTAAGPGGGSEVGKGLGQGTEAGGEGAGGLGGSSVAAGAGAGAGQGVGGGAGRTSSLGVPLVGGLGPFAQRTSSLSRDLVRSSVDWVQRHWSPSHKDLLVRPFASLGAALQLGWCQYAAADFTRLSAKLDLGLPAVSHRPPGKSQQQQQQWPHPAFGLEGRGAWHALTLSLRQQLVGPLRGCVDLSLVWMGIIAAKAVTHNIGVVLVLRCQDYKLVNDRVPKGRQWLRRAAEYRRGIDGRARNNA